jgi:hypothetical protein
VVLVLVQCVSVLAAVGLVTLVRFKLLLDLAPVLLHKEVGSKYWLALGLLVAV